MPSELQWDRLYNLINGLPQIDWYVYQIEVTGNYLYIYTINLKFKFMIICHYPMSNILIKLKNSLEFLIKMNLL